MFVIKKIDKKCYYRITAEFDKHIANGNSSEFEIHLEDAYGDPVMAYYILRYAFIRRIMLKIYCTGEIINGGVALILGSKYNVCYSCTSLYIYKPHKRSVYYTWWTTYHKYIYRCLLRESEYEECNVNKPISGGELFSLGLFVEFRHEYRRQVNSQLGQVNYNINPSINEGYICSCKKCKGFFHSAFFLPYQLCACGKHSPLTEMCDCVMFSDPYAVKKGVTIREVRK